MIKRKPDFITDLERDALVEWMDNSGELKDGYEMNLDTFVSFRQTTQTNTSVIMFPKVAIDIQNRIIDEFGFSKKDIENVAYGKGMVAIKINEGGDTYTHYDQVRGPHHSLTFNVVLSAADKGGLLYIEDELIPLKEKELHIYVPTKQLHGVSKVEKGKRYLWIWRFKFKGDIL